jgi:hypothetical protein
VARIYSTASGKGTGTECQKVQHDGVSSYKRGCPAKLPSLLARHPSLANRRLQATEAASKSPALLFTNLRKGEMTVLNKQPLC